MANQCLEFTTERVALDPIDHEATITGTGCHSAVCINEVEVVTYMLPALDQVIVGVATC
jgi:pyruvate/2-oxoglutarate/acetoin dehydrogenase E1 component